MQVFSGPVFDSDTQVLCVSMGGGKASIETYVTYVHLSTPTLGQLNHVGYSTKRSLCQMPSWHLTCVPHQVCTLEEGMNRDVSLFICLSRPQPVKRVVALTKREKSPNRVHVFSTPLSLSLPVSRLRERTHSLWAFLMSEKQNYLNPFYSPAYSEAHPVLAPSTLPYNFKSVYIVPHCLLLPQIKSACCPNSKCPFVPKILEEHVQPVWPVHAPASVHPQDHPDPEGEQPQGRGHTAGAGGREWTHTHTRTSP